MYWRHFAIIISVLSFLVSMVSEEATGGQKGPTTGAVDPVVESSLGMKFVYIPPGTFMMGSPPKEKGREKDEIRHQVTLTGGFYMQTTEVTVGQWRAFVRDTGFKTDAETSGGAFIMKDREWRMVKDHYWDNSGFSQSENHPVTCVSWNDAQAFVKWLSRKEGKTYRLPTEAEWEYACRAGTGSRFSWGDKADCSRANFGNSWTSECKRKEPLKTVKVGSYGPNPWGLYDMHGNVWEWCLDWDGYYPEGNVTDPEGPEAAPKKIVRGGSWWSYSRFCRSAVRANNSPERRMFTLGFRIVMTP